MASQELVNTVLILRPGDSDNETPREGVGNQNEGHPSDHADVVGGLADEQPDCVD